jgi:GTPase SAR1 family protein
MVLQKDGKIFLKIVYWGMGGSGKTTILKTLYDLTKEKKKDIVPVGDLQMIAKDSGATLYFDRGLFYSTKEKEIYYRIYTIAGQKAFVPLRRKVFDKLEGDTDAVILVVDSQTMYLEDNLESLLELKSIANDRLIKEIPLIIMLNKQDLNEVIDEEVFKLVLKNERLWIDSNNKLSIWNPIIYKTCAIFDHEKDIYRSFHESARRATLYQIYGKGRAPIDYDPSILI